jgi:hypothetical protein
MITYQDLRRESRAWGGLSHRNVLPFIGLYNLETFPMPVLISPFCGYGDVGGYVKKYPDAKKGRLVSIRSVCHLGRLFTVAGSRCGMWAAVSP